MGPASISNSPKKPMIDIRAIRQSDVDACYDIVRDNWNKAIADRFLIEVAHVWAIEMDNPPSYYVADNDRGEIIAFAGMMSSFLMDGVWDIPWVNVKQGFQKEGLGSRLMTHMIGEIKQCGGGVIHLMTKTPDYFVKLGFTKVTEYGDWNLMSRYLRPLKL